MTTGVRTSRQAHAAWLDYLTLERRASPRTVRAYGDNVLAYLNVLERHQGVTNLVAHRLSPLPAGTTPRSRDFR